jgi:thioredoxin 1
MNFGGLLARGLALCLFVSSSTVAFGCDQGTQTPGQSETIVLSLQKVDCEGCMFNVVENVQKHEAVRSATFDLASAEMTIAYDAKKASVADLVDLVKRNGYLAVEGGGQGTFMPEVPYPSQADVQAVEAGADFDPDAQVVSGKLTIVDFYAPWCQPCHLVDEHLAGLTEERSDLAVRRVDVRSWDSDLAKRFLAGSRALPLLLVYGTDGEKLGEVRGADTAKLDEILAAVAPPESAPPPGDAPPPSK